MLELPFTLARGPSRQEVSQDIARMRTLFVNLYFVGAARHGAEWVLIDAGIPGFADQIVEMAEERFGRGTPPVAIVLTHAHFDHRGSLPDLLRVWDVPVYAHRLELPYLTGRADYPPPDPTVGGGLMARSASLFSRSGIDLGRHIETLPEDRSVPGMPGWRWVHTPGHSPGHVSFFRESDRTLIAGDAFVTTKQESLLAVLSQHRKVHGPPAYFTIDWDAARESVRTLARLRPGIAVTGHGLPMAGEPLQRELDHLAEHFDQEARPRYGRYVPDPAVANETGVVWVPPPIPDPMPMLVAVIGLTAATAFIVASARPRRT